MFCSFNLGGGGRAGAKIINTNANTNTNTGASVTVNSRAPEVPSDGSGDGRSYGYGRWGYKPYYHRSGSSGRLSEQDLKYFEMLEDMNVESVTFDPSLKKFRESRAV